MRSPMRTFPDGLMMLPVPTARTTSSGDMLYDRNLSGSTCTTIVRWLEPNGGGAETPGRVANIGRTRNRAASCSSAASVAAFPRIPHAGT